MKIPCIWEHNGNDTLLYAASLPGAYTRGATPQEAVDKMPAEIRSYLAWAGLPVEDSLEVIVTEEKASDLTICDADSDVLFEFEKAPLSKEEYEHLKALALKSAEDFEHMYHAIPDVDITSLTLRKTFYGNVPATARQMYEHTKSVTSYYFAEIDVTADNEGTMVECRRRGFETLEKHPNFLDNPIISGSYGEDWTLRKVLRRFIWHDRIHARAMYRMALKQFGSFRIENPFFFTR